MTLAVATAMTSCVDEIEHGTTDIDSWPLPRVEVTIPETFTHPGVVFDQDDIDRWRDIVLTRRQPQYDGYLILEADLLSRPTYQMNGPYSEIYSGQNDRYPVNIQNQIANDFGAACQNAIMFAATRQKAHADKALEIIRAYSNATLGSGMVFHAGGGGRLDNVLLVGNLCAKLVYAIELMRYLPDSGMTDNDFADACEMCKRCFVPTLDYFFSLTDKDWLAIGNFGAAAMNCYVSMAILLDNTQMYDYAVNRYLTGYDNGSIRYYIDAETGQCQETGRDQTHAQLGLGMLSMLCENAWKQGTDLYGVLDNRLQLGYEYTARYNLGYDCPFKFMPELSGKYNWYAADQVDNEELLTGQRTEGRRGKFSPVYERVYNHYVTRLGLSMPYVKEVLETKDRPEGNGAPDTAHLGFGTFLYCSEGY